MKLKKLAMPFAAAILAVTALGYTTARAHEPVPLCDALKPRALNIAEIIYNRINQNYGGWHNWSRHEGLKCEFPDYDKVVFRRTCNAVGFDCTPDDTWIVFDNIHPSDFKIEDWGKPEIIDSSVVNNYSQELIIPAGSKVSHTWTTSSTLTDSLLNTVTLGLKARSLTILGSVYQGQFSEQIEVEISASYQRQFGETVTKSSTDTTTLEQAGPAKGRFLNTRTNTKERRRVVSNVDLEHSIEFAGNWHGSFSTVVYPQFSFATMAELLSGAEGLLPESHSGYCLFGVAKKCPSGFPGRVGSQSERQVLRMPANSPVEVDAVYSDTNDKFLFEQNTDEAESPTQSQGAIQ